MKLRIAFATLLAAIFFAAVPAHHAAAATLHSPLHDMFFKGDKKVKFNISNQTGAPLELKIDDKITTIQPGQVQPFKLPVGTRVLSNTATEHLHVGDVVVQVSDSMYSDSTIAIGK